MHMLLMPSRRIALCTAVQTIKQISSDRICDGGAINLYSQACKNMSEQYFHYPRKALFKDYLQSFAGAAIFSAPLIVAWSNPYVAVILGAIAIMFLSFGFSTWRRHRTSIVVTDEAIGLVGAKVVRMAWQQIDQVDLRYFSTRRERGRLTLGDEKGGWMEMKLHSEGQVLRIDSSLENFQKLAGYVVEASGRFRIKMTPVAKENFAALGLAPDNSWSNGT